MAGRASAVAAAGMIKADTVVEGNVEDGLLFAMLLVGQLAVLQGHGLAFGQKGALDGVFAGAVYGHHACSLLSLVCHAAPSVPRTLCRPCGTPSFAAACRGSRPGLSYSALRAGFSSFNARRSFTSD